MKFCKFLFILVFFLLNKFSVSQDNDSTINWDIFDMSLAELMNIKVTSTSKNVTSLRESPGIVSVITESEIKNSGARDLVDLLNIIPGLDFGAEWDNIIGVGVRGNNATEGKILILLDGFQLNETNFGIFPFGQHVLINNISKIEIIRGPGSVVYGGSAELAVINIITKYDYNNIFETIEEYSISEGNTLRYNFQSSYNNKSQSGLKYNISGYYGNSNRSNRKYHTLDTSIIHYKNYSDITTINLNTHLNYKSLNLQFIYDKYLSDNTEAEGQILFEGLYSGLDYNFKFNDKISVKPKLIWMRQKPWYFVNYTDKETYNTINNRISGNISVSYKPYKILDIVAGSEYFYDNSNKENDTILFNLNNSNHISFSNYAFFGEIMLKSRIANLTVGARYDMHDTYGSAFVPRIALTKAFKRFHFKAIYSQAFKAPTISNIDYNDSIKAEKTTVLELEAGYQITPNMNLSVNLFDIQILDPIFWEPDPVNRYVNFDKTGSRGFEIVYKLKPGWGYLNLAYSYYEKNKNTVEAYNIEGNSKTYGAFPMHKASINSNIKITKKLKLNCTLLFYGDRYTYIHTDKNWNNVSLVKYDEKLIFNLFLTYQNIIFKNLDISLGIYDLTNSHFEYINAYQGGQNPIPAPGRELSFRLSYNIE